jgi:hypothetical protein
MAEDVRVLPKGAKYIYSGRLKSMEYSEDGASLSDPRAGMHYLHGSPFGCLSLLH